MSEKIFEGKYTLEQLRQNFVMLNADEIELPRTWLLELIILAQETEKLRELQQAIATLYAELKKKQISYGDCVETYTTGYRNGHTNGQIELLERILNIDIGLRSEDK